MEILRTPDERFENLPGYPFAPHYTEVPDGEGGELRVHHVEEGPADGPIVLCIHGQPSWSYLYRHMIPLLTEAGCRVLAPDLVGYGRSDKPAAREDYTYERQVGWMNAWLAERNLQDATFFGQDWGGLIGLRMVAENEDRFGRVLISNTGLPLPLGISEERIAAYHEKRRTMPTPSIEEMMAKFATVGERTFEQTFVYWQRYCWDTERIPVGNLIASMADGRALSAEEMAAYDAPFPDASYMMGPRAMPSQVPTLPDDPAVPGNTRAWGVFANWQKPFECAFSDNDPVSAGGDVQMSAAIPGAATRSHTRISGGGHFLQEGRAAEVCERLITLIRETGAD